MDATIPSFSGAERYHGLDAARALALLLGVTLHSAASMIPKFPTWPIEDVQAGPAPAAIALGIHLFRMSVFFLMAGFFGRMVCRSKGTGYFVKDRLRRILLPLVAGWFILFPLVRWVWLWGAQHQGTLAAGLQNVPLWKVALLSPIAVLTGNLRFSLVHLWFLYYLLLFYVVGLAIRPLLGGLGQRADDVMRVVIGRWWGFLLGAIPVAGALIAADLPVGLTNPESLVPVPVTAFVYGLFFFSGWSLHRQPALLKSTSARWLGYELAFVTLTLVVAVGYFRQVASPLLCSGCALGMWCGVLGFTGACLRFASTPSRIWRYLSDASYWIYLMHVVPVVYLQVVIARWPLHWAWKILLIHVVVLPPLLISYQFLVRATFIGAVLNGHRKPLRATTIVATPVAVLE